jgi:hypothetical protein
VSPVIEGLLIVGAVPNTNAPVPVSSLMTPASCADVVAANMDKLSALYATTLWSVAIALAAMVMPVPAVYAMLDENRTHPTSTVEYVNAFPYRYANGASTVVAH